MLICPSTILAIMTGLRCLRFFKTKNSAAPITIILSTTQLMCYTETRKNRIFFELLLERQKKTGLFLPPSRLLAHVALDDVAKHRQMRFDLAR